MKITKQQLKQIIKEELRSILKEDESADEMAKEMLRNYPDITSMSDRKIYRLVNEKVPEEFQFAVAKYLTLRNIDKPIDSDDPWAIPEPEM